MKKDLTLLILAGGMGSRFGGLKQIEPVGPSGEFIIDYSIYDAINAGFTKVVFLIKEEMFDIFRETVGKRIESKIKVEYAFQRLTDIPKGYTLPEDRVKPLGTAQAVLSCKNVINENFVMINADDFYGRSAYRVIKDYFDKNENEDYTMVGFNVINTMTENGAVKRGVCEQENGCLTKIIESSIEKVGDEIIATPLDGRGSFSVQGEDLVSMNFFGFRPSIFKTLEDNFPNFLDNNKDNLLKCEYLIPDVVDNEIHNGRKVRVLESNDRWLGVTYKEDKEYVVNEIRSLVDKGIYPDNLWK